MDSLADSIFWLASFISLLTARKNVLNTRDKASDTFLTTSLIFLTLQLSEVVLRYLRSVIFTIT